MRKDEDGVLNKMKSSMQKLLKTKHIFALLLITLLLSLHLAQGTSPFAPSPYNSYTRQALAWREGRSYLSTDVPHLELALKDGHYYVSFPPVPSIPLFLLSFIFGIQTPDGLLVKLYALVAYYALVRALKSGGMKEGQAALCSFLLCTASSMLPLMLSGAVWYQAQVMAFMLTSLSIDRMQQKHYTASLLFYALSVGCRPFNVLYGPVLFFLYVIQAQKPGKLSLRPLLPGIVLGLCVAAAYAWYNWIRFSNPLEFGHNHLPEFSFQGGTQFSLKHVSSNARSFIFSLPFEQSNGTIKLKQFGFSLFIANPALLLLLFLFIHDIATRRASSCQVSCILLFSLHLLLLLCHRTFGGFQFGARYAVDLIPYAAIYLIPGGLPKAWEKPCLLVMLAGLVFSIYGSLLIRLPT